MISLNYYKRIYPALLFQIGIYGLGLLFITIHFTTGSAHHIIFVILRYLNIIYIGYLASKFTEKLAWNSIKGGMFLVFVWIPIITLIEAIIEALYSGLSLKLAPLAALGMIFSQFYIYPYTFIFSLIGGYIASKFDLPSEDTVTR